MPVEKAPIKKYFRDASVIFKLVLSLPVRMYKGIDIISIPKNNINNVLYEDDIATPHNTKNMRAKYSETFLPTFSISLPFNKKYKSVQPSAMVLKSNPKL